MGAHDEVPDTALDQVAHSLRRIERLLAIGFAEQVSARRMSEGIDDEVVDAILDLASVWSQAGPLKAAVKKRSGGAPRTIERRLGQLVDLGALERRGKGASTEYRASGLYG